MDFVQSAVMGFVQGLSEFLPISSSGHLVFTSNFYKIFNNLEIIQESNQEVFLDIMLHIGTLIAVLIYFRKQIYSIIKDFIIGLKEKNYNSENFKTGLYIIIGTFITVLVAYPLSEFAARLLYLPAVVGSLLVITGLLLITSEIVSKKYADKKEITFLRSLLIAIAQGFASLPGLSRSGLTIAVALLSGVDRVKAAEYSFLLSIPVIMGASVIYPFVKIDLQEFITFDWFSIIIGTIVSALVGYLCIKYFIKFLSKFSLKIFGYYCILVGIFVFIFFNWR